MDPIGGARHEDEDVRRQLPGHAHQAKDEGQHDDVDSGENELSWNDKSPLLYLKYIFTHIPLAIFDKFSGFYDHLTWGA